jgi:hypothetical protein
MARSSSWAAPPGVTSNPAAARCPAHGRDIGVFELAAKEFGAGRDNGRAPGDIGAQIGGECRRCGDDGRDLFLRRADDAENAVAVNFGLRRQFDARNGANGR